ncbi:hypothetical protein RND81_04G148800 [Saponaria officinalis]|uniref:Water stress and hypersensitive response domain-containing protein n=1 Tax=Saponaria officinalis TaxID=3572 RepID=A0AAW1LJI8_SAPOF
MGKKVKFNWPSILLGATAATVATTLISAKPKPPSFRLVSLTALRLKLNNGGSLADDVKFPRLDADLILNVHVSNPNILPVSYGATSLSIYYDGSLLGSAEVPAGSQRARSCELLRLPARLNGLELAQHAKRFVGDVAKREMVLNADVDICGWVKAYVWDPKFKVHVDSRIVVDPVLLDVVDQENESTLRISV